MGINRKSVMFVFSSLSRAACFTFGQLQFEWVRGSGEGGWREGGALACRFGYFTNLEKAIHFDTFRCGLNILRDFNYNCEIVIVFYFSFCINWSWRATTF